MIRCCVAIQGKGLLWVLVDKVTSKFQQTRCGRLVLVARIACSPQSRSLSLRRRAAALSPSCQAPRTTGLRRSNLPLPPSGCRMRWQAEEPSSRRSRSVVAFEAANLEAQQGLCSRAIMRTPVVKAVVPWLSRARLCDVRGIGWDPSCHPHSRQHCQSGSASREADFF